MLHYEGTYHVAEWRIVQIKLQKRYCETRPEESGWKDWTFRCGVLYSARDENEAGIEYEEKRVGGKFFFCH